MPKKTEFIRFNTIKSYIKDIRNMRSNETAVDLLASRFNSLIADVITRASASAKGRGRNTISQQDIKDSLEKTVGKKHLDWRELLDEILLQNPIELGSLAKGIAAYIEKDKK